MKEHIPKASINTQRSYSSALKHLLPFFGNSGLSSITPKMLYAYRILRRGEGAKPATINMEQAIMSKVFSLAVREWEWLKENPVSKVPKEKENNERDRWLTGEDEKRLLEDSPQWLRDIIVFNLHTGLRQSELLCLQWNRVNLFNKTIIIQESKSGKPRTIPLNQVAIAVLVQKSKVRNLKNDFAFLSSVGTKIHASNLRKFF